MSLFHLHTNTHAHLNVGYTCRHYTHAYICIYIRTSHVRAPQGKLIKVCYKKYTASLRYYLVSTFSIFHSIFFCLLSPHDTDKCMWWPWRASMRCDLLFRTRHTYIRTADKIYYVHMHRCMFLGACMYARDVRTYDCSMTLTADDAN